MVYLEKNRGNKKSESVGGYALLQNGESERK